MDNEPMVMTPDEVAAALQISRNLTYELLQKGVIPNMRLGRRIVIPIKRFLAWLETAGDAPCAA